MGFTKENWIDADAADRFERQIRALGSDLESRSASEDDVIKARRRTNLLTLGLG